MTDPTCPECRNGKHVNCTGDALDEDTDTIVACTCTDCWETCSGCYGMGVTDLFDAVGGIIRDNPCAVCEGEGLVRV